MDKTTADKRPVKAHIWYDSDGVILAVGHAPERAGESGRSERHATALAVQDQYVLDVEVPADAIHELHATQRVDVVMRALVAQKRTTD